MISKIMDKINKESLRADRISAFSVGDTVKIQVKIHEGDKDRLQVFSGTVIARKGRGATETFTVRKISHGVGVERVFPVHSPMIAAIEVESSGKVRRAKLYFMRRQSARRSRLEEKVTERQEPVAAGPAASAPSSK
jgi:large subunit ribosomal protein L19